MTTTILSDENDDLTTSDYLIIGLATCFIKEDGEVRQVEVIEPIPSAALEVILRGIPTSYKLAYATTIGEVLSTNAQLSSLEFPNNAKLGEEFQQRAIAATRTYKRKGSVAKIIPLGTKYTELNYSIERKRLLNHSRLVTRDDNIKQHPNTHKVL